MKRKLLTTWACLIALLFITSIAFAASNAVNIGTNGITFPDNSVQTTAAQLPSCSSGEFITNNLGSWVCGSIKPVTRGISTCVSNVCSVSACESGFGNCDGNATNGCETTLNTIQNCGGCGIACGVNEVCSVNLTCVLSPNAPGSVALAANPASGVTNNNLPVTLTATVSPAGQGGVIANGTVVTFNIVSGVGGSLSSQTATTTNGVASVTLNSTTAGTIEVTASAGTAPASTPVSVTFIDQPTLVIVKVKTTGTLPNATLIGGLTATVTANPSSGLTIAGADVTKSGAGAAFDSFISNTTIFPSRVSLSALSINGIQTGEFATLNFHIAPGTFPTVNDFSIALVNFQGNPTNVVDTNSVILNGIGVAVQSVTIQ